MSILGRLCESFINCISPLKNRHFLFICCTPFDFNKSRPRLAGKFFSYFRKNVRNKRRRTIITKFSIHKRKIKPPVFARRISGKERTHAMEAVFQWNNNYTVSLAAFICFITISSTRLYTSSSDLSKTLANSLNSTF